MNISKKYAEQLFNEHANYIYRGALFLTHSEVLAEDITQEVFLQVFRKYNMFNPTKPIRPWIYKIMLNTTRNVLKKKRHHITLQEDNEQIASIDLEKELLIAETNKEIWKKVCTLTTKTKEVIYMHYYLDMTLEEIAEILEIPVGTCKSRLNAGLKKLRQSISKTTNSPNTSIVEVDAI